MRPHTRNKPGHCVGFFIAWPWQSVDSVDFVDGVVRQWQPSAALATKIHAVGLTVGTKHKHPAKPRQC
jgi:hypothetical protein